PLPGGGATSGHFAQGLRSGARAHRAHLVESHAEPRMMPEKSTQKSSPQNGKAARRDSSMNRDTERQKQKLITMGKAKGYVTYDEVNDHMPEEIVSSDQIDDWLSTLGDEGIEVVDAGQGSPGTTLKVPAGRAAVAKLPEVPEVIEDDEEASASEETSEKE